MNNVRNWLLGTAAIVIATSVLLAAFSSQGQSAHAADAVPDSMQVPF